MVNDFITILRNHNLKATTQRVAILNFIYKNGHSSIDEIYKELIKDYPSISLNTIYLNVDLLTKNSILTQISIDKSRDKYEITKKEHIHLICEKCHSVIDKEIPSQLLNSLNFDTFFEKKRVINIYGICQKCYSNS